MMSNLNATLLRQTIGFRRFAGPPRLRVCQVSASLSTGGLERLLVDLARLHDRDRFEMTFVALHDEGQPAREIRALGCRVLTLQSQKAGHLGRIRQLKRLFREVGVDVVHTHNAVAHIDGTPAAKLAGVRVIVQTWHAPRFELGRLARWQYRLACRFGSRVVAVSDDAARIFRDEVRLKGDKVVRIRDGIDVERFPFRGPTSRPAAISVGRLSADDDLPTLLRAVALARKVVPDLCLRIVGDGPERGALEQLCRDLAIGDSVEFLGERQDLPALLGQSAFFASATLREGVSRTLLEAMAVGLPVVTTSAGDNPEVVEQGVTGWLAPPSRPEALAAAIVSLCAERQDWNVIGECGRQRVVEHFDVRRTVQDYEALYERELLLARG